MSKAVLSNRIYLNCARDSELNSLLMKELTYTIDQQPVSEYPLVICNVVRISDTVVSIPSGRVDLIPKDYDRVYKQACTPVEIPEPNFTPRQNQQDAIDYLEGSGLVEAKVG